jgi:hypothetical protein
MWSTTVIATRRLEGPVAARGAQAARQNARWAAPRERGSSWPWSSCPLASRSHRRLVAESRPQAGRSLPARLARCCFALSWSRPSPRRSQVYRDTDRADRRAPPTRVERAARPGDHPRRRDRWQRHGRSFDPPLQPPASAGHNRTGGGIRSADRSAPACAPTTAPCSPSRSCGSDASPADSLTKDPPRARHARWP